MENTTSATTKKVKNDMPYDIAFLITSKLPPKSVKRFGCLCKSWDLNFENPHFMSIFRNNFISNHRSRHAGASLLLPITRESLRLDTQLYSLEGEKFENKRKLDWPTPFSNDDNFLIWGSYSVNGILYLTRGFKNTVFWNPSTKEFKVIPCSPYAPPPGDDPLVVPLLFRHGFGFDNVRNDYKLIRLWRACSLRFEPFWEIYSLRSNSWKKLDGLAPPSRLTRMDGFGAQLYTEGMCHWWGLCMDKTKYGKDSMILSSFDLGNEVFIATPIITPDKEDDDDLRFHFILLNGSIALISYLGVGKKGELFFIKDNNDELREIVYFDSSTRKTHELGLKSYSNCALFVYKESLIPEKKERKGLQIRIKRKGKLHFIGRNK